jgi:hypothetical protein
MNNWPTENNTDEMAVPGREGSLDAAIVYADDETRDRATRVCDGLVRKFWREFGLEFTWWRFDFLRDPDIARVAAKATSEADLVLFSAHAGRELPSHVTHWMDDWLPLRGNRQGMLGALIGTTHDSLAGLTPIHVYLREAARMAGMDFLPDIMDAPLGDLERLGETLSQRERSVTPLLDQILAQGAIPLRWGINE